MTALITYRVYGLSALVPGTALRLPVLPDVRNLPADQRCHGCAGTGVNFAAGTLATCYCLELVAVPSLTECGGLAVAEVLV